MAYAPYALYYIRPALCSFTTRVFCKDLENLEFKYYEVPSSNIKKNPIMHF